VSAWAADYIGLPWKAGAFGPFFYDCMSFFRHIQGQHFGINVPPIIAPDYDDAAALTSLFRKHEERDKWVRIPHQEHGCAVIIHRPMHIGTWLDSDGGGVLHCQRGAGVVFTKKSAWPTSGLGRCEYYKHAKAP
jgi:hypothetical protein